MKTYQELVNECPELGDAFAEFENRVSYLENLRTPANSTLYQVVDNQTEQLAEIKESPVNNDSINQLRAMVYFLQKKFNEHIDGSKKRNKGVY